MFDITKISWDEYERLSFNDKKHYLENPSVPGAPFHTLFAQQFDRQLLERLAMLANDIRFLSKKKEGALYLKSLLR